MGNCGTGPTSPTVSVVIPALNEATHIDRCLKAVGRQTYDRVEEILVVDGGSEDGTAVMAARHHGVRVLTNPRRIQAAALNIGLREATGEIVVRVDGHCEVEPDYIERCVEALGRSGAAMVGGAMRPTAETTTQRAIAAAMSSPFGAGPARFHVGGRAGWVDTVYLGAYRLADARAVGGYAENVGVNEDAEFAHRLRACGGVWFDPSIRSTYVPRSSLRTVARQFWRYGLSRAATVRRHPRSLRPRQLVAPALLMGLASPWRTRVGIGYVTALAIGTGPSARRAGAGPTRVALVAGVMHLTWGAGFLAGIMGFPPPAPAPAPDEV